MRTFGKSSKLDNVLYDVRGPVVDEAARMEEDGMEGFTNENCSNIRQRKYFPAFWKNGVFQGVRGRG